MVRRACLQDIKRVAGIYEAIHHKEEQGELTVGWAAGVYPVEQTALDSLSRGDLFVLEREGTVVAAAIINRKQMPEYAQCPWGSHVPEDAVMVLHTLVVDPEYHGNGAGREFVKFYEEFAKQHGCRQLRMDTQEKNRKARAFYNRLGYTEVGVVPCTFNGIPGVRLVCLKKEL